MPEESEQTACDILGHMPEPSIGDESNFDIFCRRCGADLHDYGEAETLAHDE